MPRSMRLAGVTIAGAVTPCTTLFNTSIAACSAAVGFGAAAGAKHSPLSSAKKEVRSCPLN